MAQYDLKNFSYKYQVNIASFWNSKTLYLAIIEKFLNNKISQGKFVTRFNSLWQIDLAIEKHNKKQILENLDSKDLIKLPEYACLIHSIAGLYEPAFYLDTPSISEKELRKELEVLFVKLKKLIDD